MSRRAVDLLETVDAQVSELIAVLHTNGQDALRRPCRGRENLGDGSVAATAQHLADSYQRIAQLVLEATATAATQGGDAPSDGAQHQRDHRGTSHTADDVELSHVIQRVVGGRAQLNAVLADISDEQLDLVPPPGSARFCDGRRTLERVIRGALNHQQHHVYAIKESGV